MSQTPSKSIYTGPIVIDPVTRLEGHLRIEVDVENGMVVDARSSATLFRGIEKILIGRDPRDAHHFTQRVCGVCTYVHALGSIRALEDAVGINVPQKATLIRNLVLGTQTIHDHIIHFYHLHSLDFVDVTAALSADVEKAARLARQHYPRPLRTKALREVQTRLKTFVDGGQLGIFTNAYFLGGHPSYKLDAETNLLLTAHYLEALRLQVKTAKAMAIFGGKNPHPQFLVGGGVTCYDSLSPDRLKEFEEIWAETNDFIHNVYLQDIKLLAAAYPEWTQLGGNENFMAFGEYPTDERDLESRWLKPGILIGKNASRHQKFDPGKIVEHVRHSWYEGDTARKPYQGETNPDFTFLGDKDRYSWNKAPRYDGQAMETGPLAQVLVDYVRQEPATRALVDSMLKETGLEFSALYSTLGRTMARAIHATIIGDRIETWMEELGSRLETGNIKLVEPWLMPYSGEGVGFLDAPRGGLSHWMVIENKKIANYQMVVPSTWNFGPKCDKNIHGPVEAALIGTPIADPKRPVEVLRTVHSFDPCIACSVHLLDLENNDEHTFRIV